MATTYEFDNTISPVSVIFNDGRVVTTNGTVSCDLRNGLITLFGLGNFPIVINPEVDTVIIGATTYDPDELTPVQMLNALKVLFPNEGGGSGSTPTLQQVISVGGLTNGATIREGTRNNGYGGGIAQICANNKELQWEDGVLYFTPENNGYIVSAFSMNNVIPNENYDRDHGYNAGSRFKNLITGIEYLCTYGAPENATWIPVTSTKILQYRATIQWVADEAAVIVTEDSDIGTPTVNYNNDGDFDFVFLNNTFFDKKVFIRGSAANNDYSHPVCFYGKKISDSTINIINLRADIGNHMTAGFASFIIDVI